MAASFRRLVRLVSQAVVLRLIRGDLFHPAQQIVVIGDHEAARSIRQGIEHLLIRGRTLGKLWNDLSRLHVRVLNRRIAGIAARTTSGPPTTTAGPAPTPAARRCPATSSTSGRRP